MRDVYKKFKTQSEDTGSDAEANEIGDKNKDISKLSNLPSGNPYTDDSSEQTGGLAAATKFVNNLFGDFFGTMKQVGVNFRDDLYVTDYIMNMFSYDTFENEVKYEWAKSDKKEIKISNYVSIYNSYNEAWKASKDKLTVTENKTLTNKMLCEDNNYAYGSEIEFMVEAGREILRKHMPVYI